MYCNRSLWIVNVTREVNDERKKRERKFYVYNISVSIYEVFLLLFMIFDLHLRFSIYVYNTYDLFYVYVTADPILTP